MLRLFLTKRWVGARRQRRRREARLKHLRLRLRLQATAHCSRSTAVPLASKSNIIKSVASVAAAACTPRLLRSLSSTTCKAARGCPTSCPRLSSPKRSRHTRSAPQA